MLKSNRTIIALIILTVASAFMTSCNRKTVYYHFEHTDFRGWNKADTLLYNIGAFRDSGTFECHIGARISNDYPYQSITLVVEQTIYPEQTTVEDTLVCNFTDSIGNILGNGLSIYQYEYHLHETVINANDSVVYKIWHNMRQEEIVGITDIGIELNMK